METKNKKTVIILSITIPIAILCLIAFGVGIYYLCFGIPPTTKKHMKEYYQNDANYITLQATVDEVKDDYGLIVFSDLETDEFFYGGISFKVFAIDSHQLLLDINLKKGDVIEIITLNHIFYDGYKYPIVSIKKDGVEYLSFDDGKAALLDWVNNLK